MGRAIGLPDGSCWALQPFSSDIEGTFGELDCEELGSVAVVWVLRRGSRGMYGSTYSVARGAKQITRRVDHVFCIHLLRGG